MYDPIYQLRKNENRGRPFLKYEVDDGGEGWTTQNVGRAGNPRDNYVPLIFGRYTRGRIWYYVTRVRGPFLCVLEKHYYR